MASSPAPKHIYHEGAQLPIEAPPHTSRRTLTYSLHERARNVGVSCQAGSNACGPRVSQRNVNYARWNVILIVAVEEDKQERREGCFVADLSVNVFSTTIADLVSFKI